MLKLKAQDAEDIQVISAVLQDAIAPVCDIAWRPADKNFIMVVQRLCREAPAPAGLERICCALNIRGVAQAQIHGLDLKATDRMLDLLAVLPEGNTVTFVFSGDAAIKLTLVNAGWSMVVEDFGESWPAACEPCHEQVVSK